MLAHVPTAARVVPAHIASAAAVSALAPALPAPLGELLPRAYTCVCVWGGGGLCVSMFVTALILRFFHPPLNNSKYKTGTSTLPCSTCGGCPSGQHRLSCGGSNPGLCMACPSCPGGQYRLGCSNSTSGTCVSCPSCPPGLHRVACGGTSEGICSTCPTGWGMCSLFSFVKPCPWMHASPVAT